MKYLTSYILILSLIRLIISSFTFAMFSPLVYLAGNQLPAFEQAQLMLSFLPEIMLVLFAIWIAINQKFQYYLIIALVGYYNTFLAQLPLAQGMKYNWGETDILAISGTVSAISMLVFYLSAFIIFCVWLYRWKPAQRYPG